MNAEALSRPSFSRTILELMSICRLGTLPTVISNCLAGWILSGAGNTLKFLILTLCLCTLQTAISWILCLVELPNTNTYKLRHPWLSTRIPLHSHWFCCAILLWIGIFLAALCGQTIALIACLVILIGGIIALTHRIFLLSALGPGLLRALYYIAGGCVSWGGLLGYTLWGAIAIFFFMLGCGLITRRPPQWGATSMTLPIISFIIPLLLALLINDGNYRTIGICFSSAVGLWLVYIFYQQTIQTDPSLIPTYLVSTICLYDFLAAGIDSIPSLLILGFLFIFTLWSTQSYRTLSDQSIIL